MSDECAARPDLCDRSVLWRERDETKQEALRGELAPREDLEQRWEEPEAGRAAEAPPAAGVPATVLRPPEVGVIVRHKGLLLRSYWEVVNDAVARVGDVVVVLPDRWLLMRRVRRPALWSNADERYYVSGYVDKQICAYGFVPRGALDHVVEAVRRGAVIAAMCDPRARVKPPRRFELAQLWRYDGYLVNISPARLAVLRVGEGRRWFLPDIAKKGCPAYSHFVNQILQALGVLARLQC